jgi:hypothetical protein
VQPVGRRPHHPGQHQIENFKGLRVGGKVEPCFADRPPRVALPQDLQLRTVPLDHDTADVGRLRLFRFGQLDVSPLRPSEDLLLLSVVQPAPSFKIMNIALDRDVTAARKRPVLFSDQGGESPGLSLWVLGSVDESGQVL